MPEKYRIIYQPLSHAHKLKKEIVSKVLRIIFQKVYNLNTGGLVSQ